MGSAIVRAGPVRRSIRRARGIETADLLVSIWVLFTFAVAQPLLDLLGRNPEFFLARAAPRLDIVVIAVVVLVVFPGVLSLVALVARAAHLTAGLVLHGLLFTVLSAALLVSILERTSAERLDGRLSMALGLIAGAGAWAAFSRFRPMRSAFRLAIIGPPIFLLVFLVFSPTAQLLQVSGPIHHPAGVEVGNPKPVVLIVFDEFPVASLIDPDGNIFEDAFPNFSRLSREGIWFRNAVTVEQQTEHAIPAMLTGRRPLDREAIPMAADYPLSLFSLLSDGYEIRAVESVTELCPDYACSNRSRVVAPAPDRWIATGHDLSIVSAHLLLPSDLDEGLPSISQTWGNFAGATAEVRDDFDIVGRFNDHVDADRRAQVGRFLDLIELPASQPTLYFAHLLLPHIPWTYLPTGQGYVTESPAPGSTPTGWGSDEWLVMQAYQRHLLQVQYSDRIVGHVIEALEDMGIYEDSLIVIAADHGTADIPEVEHRRVITTETVGHIAAVPLFMKLPNMGRVGIDDYRAETVDVLPTIADVLDLRIPWSVEGTSLLAPTRPARESTTTHGPRGEVTFGVSGTEKLDVAARKARWFLTGDPYSLVPPGHGDLLGARLSSLRTANDSTLSIRLDHLEWYTDLDLDSDPFPARLTGTLLSSADLTGDVILAVGLNGRIEAVVRTYNTGAKATEFQVMLPIDAFQAGSNQIELIVAVDSGDQRRLLRPAG